MRKDNPIDKPITVSLFGTAASATLMVAFAIAYRIAGLFVPDTNAVMVTLLPLHPSYTANCAMTAR